jgi:subtilisin family serine protease
MEVRKHLSALACILCLSACGNPKSSQTVFQENGTLDSSACMGEKVQGRFIVEWEDGHFSVENYSDADSFTKEFLEPQLEKIKFVGFDRVVQLDRSTVREAAVPSDNWGQVRISVDRVWSQGFYGQGVKVGIVDGGVDVTNQQIRPRIAVNLDEIPNNGVDDDQNGVIDDYYGAQFISSGDASGTASDHGTHVAGVISADPNYGPIQGVAPQAQIVPAQFITTGGGGSLGDAILAMQYAAKRGAKIINASWGGAPCVESLKNSFLSLEKAGVLVVVAAGNDGRDIETYPEFPASFNLPNQITVAASSFTDFMTSWSNSGFNYVHVAAPGESILSTITKNRTAYMDGTSMAAPFVSGAAALLWSARPQATAQQIRTAIFTSVDVKPGHEFKVSTRGRINVQAALEKLKQLVP